jgi:glycine cleavage system protein P-like pyridoxal-binding family
LIGFSEVFLATSRKKVPLRMFSAVKRQIKRCHPRFISDLIVSQTWRYNSKVGNQGLRELCGQHIFIQFSELAFFKF